MDPDDLIPLFSPAADAVAAAVRAAAAAPLDSPTPCSDYPLGELVDHLAGTTAAMATLGEGGRLPAENPWGAGTSVSGGDWPAVLADNLARLAAGWGNPDPWAGEVDAGGAQMPAAMVGAMALIEIVAHGWDIAAATGQPLTVPANVARGFRACAEQTAEQGRQLGAYGPAPQGHPDGDLAAGLAATGRDIDWRPPRMQ